MPEEEDDETGEEEDKEEEISADEFGEDEAGEEEDGADEGTAEELATDEEDASRPLESAASPLEIGDAEDVVLGALHPATKSNKDRVKRKLLLFMFFFLLFGQIGSDADENDPIGGENIKGDEDEPPIPFEEPRNLEGDEKETQKDQYRGDDVVL